MTTADKLMELIGLFDSDQANWSVEEAAIATGLSPSSAYRYFRTLTEAGVIVAVTAGRYILGPRIIVLDRKMRLSDPLILAFQRATDGIEAELDAEGIVLLCRLFREQVICVFSRPIGMPSLQVSYERGRPMPLFRGASSKVILAHVPVRNVKKIFDEAPEEFSGAQIGNNWLDVKRALRAIRNDGVVVSRGEVDPGVIGIASPILNADESIVGSVGLVSNSKTIVTNLTDIKTVIKRLAEEIGNSTS